MMRTVFVEVAFNKRGGHRVLSQTMENRAAQRKDTPCSKSCVACGLMEWSARPVPGFCLVPQDPQLKRNSCAHRAVQ
jgi:hypothetical protein